jgi:serine/threonine protein kinase
VIRNREGEGRRAPLTGRQFGPYILQDLLGAGGMGEVYRARDTRLNRAVAIKVLSADLASDPERLARLAREARLLASLNHPHIGAIYELEDADGVSGLVLELIEGLTLADRLRSGALPQDVAFSIAEQIVDALAAAHAAGIVHRDLKPANIKITPQGTVKVLDFGLAKALDSTAQVDEEGSTEYSLGATRAGIVLGTPAYMSPEQARGEAVDQRTDIWAFGVVVFEMLTGRRPFAGRTTTDTIAGVLREDPDWGTVPVAAHRLLRACLHKDPTRRLQAISDARLLLDDAPGPRPTLPSAPRWFWPVLSLVSLSIAAGLALERSRQPMPDSPVVKFQIPAPRGVSLDAPIVSPDGRISAAVRRRRVEAGGRSSSCAGARGLQRRTGDQLWACLRIGRGGARLS